MSSSPSAIEVFSVRKLVTSQRFWNSERESIQDRTHRRLCSKANQPLTSLYPADREVTGTVPMSISGFKVLRISTLYDAPAHSNGLSPINVQISLDSVTQTVTYQGSQLRASQCGFNAAFRMSNPALKGTTSALHFFPATSHC
ncbi:hypothetical protein TNCV_4858121 [Trichonephila clavipes]|nr:hypothetical protein TNCV_4858121 [Trichonephila clavipes]